MTGTCISCIGRSSRIGRSSGSRRIAVRFYRRVRYGRCRSSGRHCSRSFFRKWCRCIFRYRCRRIHRIVGIHKADILFLAVHLCIGMCSHNCFQITGLSVRYCYFHIINGIVIMSVFQLSIVRLFFCKCFLLFCSLIFPPVMPNLIVCSQIRVFIRRSFIL